jgi:hypothetical protein
MQLFHKQQKSKEMCLNKWILTIQVLALLVKVIHSFAYLVLGLIAESLLNLGLNQIN